MNKKEVYIRKKQWHFQGLGAKQSMAYVENCIVHLTNPSKETMPYTQ